MILTENFEEKTGFTTIRRKLADYCMGEDGKEQVNNILFKTDPVEINRELDITEEFRTMLLTVFGYPASEYFNLEEELNYIGTPGTYLPTESLILLRISYSAYSNCILFLQNLSPDKFPELRSLVSGCRVETKILTDINRIIDNAGNIRDNASDNLLSIRKDIARQRLQIDKRIGEALNHAKRLKLVSPETEIAIRDGRSVIPVLSAFKRKLGGVIIDESATGQTAYIEPTEVFEIRNTIRELELAEKREIIKILIELADEFRPVIPDIIGSLKLVGHLDFLRAKAQLAIETNSLRPTVKAQHSFSWIQARHPLLMLSLKKQNREIVPSDIALSEENRILIISGPNAGGKSVCLKTVGLLQYMLQCGLLIPVLDTSEAGIFDHLFIDIGDQQSIENDLSTYSSHLLNIKKLLETADDSTLFLIDEFGSGTEPQSGGAIAEAVLETLNLKGSFGIVTTHYANLKMLAGQYPGFVNGAMLYDTKHMKPLFVLKTGKPGSSFAFEIASNILFPKEVLEKAGEKVGHAKLDFDKQMQDLEAERLELSQKEKQLQKADETLSELIKRYSVLKEELDSKKREILEQAKLEAKRIVGDSNKIIEKTIREIKESKAESKVTKQLRNEVKEFSEQLEIEPVETVPEAISYLDQKPDDDEIEGNNERMTEGSLVRIIGQQESGLLTQVHQGMATIAFNTVTLKVPVDKIEVLKDSVSTRKSVNRGFAYQNMVNDMNARMANFRLTIDVRGKRAEETMALIQRYVDEAIMLRVPEISILHGKGNGILRSTIRQLLQNIPEVKRISDAPIELGGAGITLVSFK